MADTTAPSIALRGIRGAIRGYVLVDAADYEWLSRYRWHLVQNTTVQYARRWERVADDVSRYHWMHREIMGVAHGDRSVEIDHRDGNGLNNQRSNLIISDRQRNSQTRRKLAPASSRYRGVCWAKRPGKWQAQIRVNGKRIYLGQYATEEEAAHAARAGRAFYLPHSRN